jgi:hypothetical protein
MKYCHRCGTEYSVNLKKCPDCGGKLHNAPGLKETVTTNEKDWVVVARARDQQEAEAIHALLDSEGIPSSVRDSAGVLKYLYGPFPFFGGSVEIYVHKTKYEKAKEVILENGEWTEDELTEYMESQGFVEEEEEEFLDTDLDV